jgi:membrane fusion protein, multidrug efflux system
MATMIEQDVEQQEQPATPPNGAPAARGNRRKLILPIVAVLALVAIAWGVTKWRYSRTHASTDDAQVDGHIIPILARVGGYITSVTVSDNDAVKAGQLLAHIDDAEYRVRLAEAEADLAGAQAGVNGRNAPGQAQAQVAAAAGQREALDAQIAAARANEVKARADLARTQELAEAQIVSQQQLDAAHAAADAAIANRRAAERQAVAGGASVTNAEAGVRVAEARLAAAKASRDDDALQLAYTRITSPADGVASRKGIEVGQLVQPGQTLMSVVADTGIWISANYKETQLSTMRVGQPAAIDVDAYGGCTALGEVESLSPATGAKFALLPPDNATGNFTKVVQRLPVRIRITRGCGADRPLRPGMSVAVHVQTGSKRDEAGMGNAKRSSQ